jgi:hypothetical protein
MYKAREVFRNNVALNASFGSRDALASMVSGAISAATMNITEYINEEKSYIQNWKQNITSKRDTFILERTVANGALFLGGMFCWPLGPLCIISTIGTQATQVVEEVETYKTSEEIDKLMHDEYNRADSYLTEKGKQVKELTKFLLTIVAMNETHISPLVYLGGVFTSYVALTVASNATKTNADVHSDLDSMYRDDLDADVKTLAGMMFDDARPPYVLDLFPISTAVRLLTSIGALWNAFEQIILIKGASKKYSKAVDDLTALRNKYKEFDIESKLREAEDLRDARLKLVDKLSTKGAQLSEYEIESFGVKADDKTLFKEVGNTKEYTFKYDTVRSVFHDTAFTGTEKGVTPKMVSLGKLERQVNRLREIQQNVNDRPTLCNIARKEWYKSGAKGMIVFSIITAAVDAVFTWNEVTQINDFIDSVVSKQTSKLETTAGVLGAWQELHKPI